MSLLQFEQKTSMLKVSGIVTPIEWDAYDEPKSFSIFQDNGREFIVRGNQSVYSFKNLVGSRVTVHGLVTLNDDHDETIDVINLQIHGSSQFYSKAS